MKWFPARGDKEGGGMGGDGERRSASRRLAGRVCRIKNAGARKLRSMLPVFAHRCLAWWRGRPYTPPLGRVRFGDLRRQTPISRYFGLDRGRPIDRYYIENFLARHGEDIRGRVLEVGDNTYTRNFGAGRVARSEVLHVSEGNPMATYVGDLANADHIPGEAFDCLIVTQTLQLIYDLRAALATLHRILKPGGVLLATFPGLSQIDRYFWGDTWYWGLTGCSAQRLFQEAFPSREFSIETHGNVLAATAFLYGLALEDLQPSELDVHDPDYQMLITVRAVK